MSKVVMMLSGFLAVSVEQAPVGPRQKESIKARNELDLLQGTWSAVAFEENGRDIPKEELKKRNLALTFKGNTFRLLVGTGAYQGTFRIDPKANPKKIDFIWTQFGGPSILPEQTLIAQGIYELADGTLKIRHGLKGPAGGHAGTSGTFPVWGVTRPKDFKSRGAWETTIYKGHTAAPGTPPAGDAGTKLAKPQPAKIRLQAAGRQKVGDAPGFALAVEVSNPNQKGPPLTFIGYKPDSFDPPIPKGRISPIHKVELKRAGKWQKQPIGWCGTGMGAIPLAPRATATFGVWVPEGDWEAVRVGVTWTTVPFEKAGAKPGDFTTEWSNELTHKEVRQGK